MMRAAPSLGPPPRRSTATSASDPRMHGSTAMSDPPNAASRTGDPRSTSESPWARTQEQCSGSSRPAQRPATRCSGSCRPPGSPTPRATTPAACLGSSCPRSSVSCRPEHGLQQHGAETPALRRSVSCRTQRCGSCCSFSFDGQQDGQGLSTSRLRCVPISISACH